MHRSPPSTLVLQRNSLRHNLSVPISMRRKKTPTWEQPDVAVLVLALPPLVRSGLNLRDTVALTEGKLVVFRSVVTVVKRGVCSQHSM